MPVKLLLFVLVVLAWSACGVGIETAKQCIVHKDCGACLLEEQAACAWCDVESKCSELNADGTIACTRGQVIYTGYCPSGGVPEQGFYERRDSDSGGFTHGYVGLALFLACLVLWRVYRTIRGRRNKAAGKAHRRQDEAWRVMRQFRAQIEMEKKAAKKAKDEGYMYDIHYADPAPQSRDVVDHPDEHIRTQPADATHTSPPPSNPPPPARANNPPPPPPPQQADSYSDDPPPPPPPTSAPPVLHGSDDGVEMTPMAKETEVKLAAAGIMNYDAYSSSGSDDAGTRQAPPARLRRRDDPISSSGVSSGYDTYSSGTPEDSSSGPPPPI